MSSHEAEAVVEQQAAIFEDLKPYLLDQWDDGHLPKELNDALANHRAPPRRT